MPTVHLLDYVAGNVRSLVNAINQVGYEVEWVRSPSDLKNAEVGTRSHFLKQYSALTLAAIETYFAWCRPLRPLPYSTCGRGLFGTYQATYRVRETFHGYLCWATGAF